MLSGIATELQKEIETDPRQKSLSHIWIDPYGQAKLLDFPASLPETYWASSTVTSPQDWKSFLHQIALFGLEGIWAPVEKLNSKIPESVFNLKLPKDVQVLKM